MKKLIFILALAGCGTPSYVSEKIHQEAEIHQGYLRLSGTLSREDLVRILRADANAWLTLDTIVNDVASVASVASVSSND